MAKKYVHSYKGKYASGHLTGAAFDIRLWRNGRRIPMCSSKIDFKKM